MIEALVVDLGGVVTRFHPERRLAALAALTGLPEATVEKRWFASGREREAELGEHSTGTIAGAIQAALGTEVAAEDLVAAWSLAFEPDPTALALLASVPLPRALFTNNGPMVDLCLAGPLREIRAVFNPVITSWRIGARKPAPEAFERAGALLGTAPAQILFLDDSAVNIRAARRHGWQSALTPTSVSVREALMEAGLLA
ncbi:MAG: HAD-IA family hydrolase [Dehalococcoidia bacterium]|nr:HAD-IA family hydrolase [Dehalococcoidia bacterium]